MSRDLQAIRSLAIAWAMAATVSCGSSGPGPGDAAVDAPNVDLSAIRDSRPADQSLLPKCGNGQLEAGEQCDGSNHGGKTCASLGFDGGQLRCTAGCAFDTQQCSKCGNSKIETGETCDGNCPTSCQTSTDPCIAWSLQGSAATCDARCVSTSLCTSGCPKNGSASSQLGTDVFTGDFMSEQDRLTATGTCKLYGRDAVYAWQAPAAGVYDFQMCSLGSYTYFGQKVTWSSCQGAITLIDGNACVANFQVLQCKSTPNARVRLTMTAGQQVLVAASRSIDTDPADGGVDLDAPYGISITQCTPTCGGKSCGDDGCGGSCGTCVSPAVCSSSGQCVCQPKCSGKSCGDDGCGGSCGTCFAPKTCSTSGQCVCQPDCSGKACGDDGCGGSCGSCPLSNSCQNGACAPDPDACDPVANLGCALPNECWLLSTEKTTCVLTGSGTQGASCSATLTCDGGYGCFAGTCRKICQRASGAGCLSSQVCNGVVGWTTYGACY